MSVIRPDAYDIDELVKADLGVALQLAHRSAPASGLASEVDVVHRHYNKPQLRSMLVGANEEYAVWARGTGKSEGLIAPRAKRNIDVMPRSHGCFVGSTYMQLIERTLPPVIKGWEQMGLVRGRDFWIREKPPKRLGIPEPIVGPLSSDHCIFFKNGTVISMVSQDRPGGANGKTVHWIIGDEAKFLNKKKLDEELLMTNRGDDRFFPNIAELHSQLYCTDMPTTKAAMWILDKQKDCDPARITALLTIQARIHELYDDLLVSKRPATILKRIGELQQGWDVLRANTVYFSEASTLDNIHGFGVKNLIKMKRNLPDFIFRTAILNQRPFLTESAFYPDLDEHHFYDMYDYAFVDTFDVGMGQYDDCRKDGDLDKWLPIEGGMDYGASINTLCLGQPHGREYRVLKELYVMHPQRLKDLAPLFCRYYRHHPTKVFRYYYDHTAIATDASRDESYADEFADALREEGWEVEMVYIGHTASPRKRYELWGRTLRGGDSQLFATRFNRHNCEYVRISMQDTQLKEGRETEGFKKDKGNERNKDLDQRQTTHFSDSVDTLICGAHMYHRLGYGAAFDSIFTS